MDKNIEKNNDDKTEIKPPNIDEDTMREMAKFFIKTSVPRILKQKEMEDSLEANKNKPTSK